MKRYELMKIGEEKHSRRALVNTPTRNPSPRGIATAISGLRFIGCVGIVKGLDSHVLCAAVLLGCLGGDITGHIGNLLTHGPCVLGGGIGGFCGPTTGWGINGFSVGLVRRRHLNGFLFLGQPEAAQVWRFGEDQLAAWRNVPSMRELVS